MRICKALLTLYALTWALPVMAYTANKVSVEFFPKKIRVYVQYTIPSRQEFREAYADFKDKKSAARLYWGLIRGADFYLGDSQQDIRFLATKTQARPW